MKKLWKILLIVLFFLLVALAIFYAIAHKNSGVPGGNTTGAGFPAGAVVGTSASVSASPSDFASGFYAWYLSHLANDFKFSTTQEFTTGLSSWLSQDFIVHYSEIAAQNENDPILQAQDYLPSWTTNITSHTIRQTAADADVEITLGTGTSSHKLMVHLVQENNQWRVSSIVSAS